MNNSTRDSRRMNRHRGKKTTDVTCQVGMFSLGPDLAVAVKDISIDGAQLIIKSELMVRSRIALSLSAPGFRKLVRGAVVVWSCFHEDLRYRIGVKFDKSLTYKELLLLT